MNSSNGNQNSRPGQDQNYVNVLEANQQTDPSLRNNGKKRGKRRGQDNGASRLSENQIMLGPPEENASLGLNAASMSQDKFEGGLSPNPQVDGPSRNSLNQVMASVDDQDGHVPAALGERDVNASESDDPQDELMKSIKQKDAKGFKSALKGVQEFATIAKTPLFAYNEESLERFEPQKQHSKYGSKIKTIIQLSLLSVFLIKVVWESVKQFNKQKSQELSTKMHNEFNYSMSDLPMEKLLPVHWFLEINKEDVVDRMECLENNNATQCEHYDEMKCAVFDKKSYQYESCMLRTYRKYDYDQKKFCTRHYQNSGLYLPSEKSTLDYVESFHSCLQRAGIPKGKKYCDKKLGLDPSNGPGDYFACYEGLDVNIEEYGEALCRFQNPIIEGQEEETSATLVQDPSLCEDDNTVKDKYGDTCATWYNDYSYSCGNYDDDDFKANEACCVCGGGIYPTISDDTEGVEPYVQCLLDKGLNKTADKYNCDQMEEGVYDEHTYRYMCWPNSQSCEDNNTVLDSYGDSCASWYNSYPSSCGGYDTDFFKANEACCICGGGATIQPENVPFAGVGDKCKCSGIIEGFNDEDGSGQSCPTNYKDDDWCYVSPECEGSTPTGGGGWEDLVSWVYCPFFDEYLDDLGVLYNDDYFTDSRGYNCSEYTKERECGNYDTDKFKASKMCTICGGGIPEVSIYCDQTRAVIESQKQCYESINETSTWEYCDAKLHVDLKWTGPKDYLACYKGVGLNTSDTHLCDHLYPLDDEKIGGSQELLKCYEAFGITLNQDSRQEKCLSNHEDNMSEEIIEFNECLIQLGSKNYYDACWLDPGRVTISLDQKQFIIELSSYGDNSTYKFEDCFTETGDRINMTAYYCWQKFEAQAYHYGKGNEAELKECFEEYNMPLSKELECKFEHAPMTDQSYQVVDNLDSSIPENCIWFYYGICQHEWTDEECQWEFEYLQYDYTYGYINEDPDTYMNATYGHVCKKVEPDYSEQIKCIAEIDQTALNKELNEKLEDISLKNSDITYEEFSNNSEYCDKVFAVNSNKAEQTESRLLCYEMLNQTVTPFQHCFEMQLTSNPDMYMYNYFYKYLCLMFRQVELDTQVLSCLDVQNLDDRLIKGRDDCLKTYEAELMPIESTDGPLFIYQQPTIIQELEEDLTFVEDKQTNFTLSEIDDFLCNQKISAIFQSSPYRETRGITTKKVNEHNTKMNCSVFEYANITRNNLMVHLYFNDSETFQNPYNQSYYYDNCQEDTCKNYTNDEMVINRTDSNEQYFNLTFSEDLNLLQILKNRLFHYKSDSPLNFTITNKTYTNFTGLSNTTKLLETYPITISRDMMPDQNLMGEQTNLTQKARNVTKRILGIPYEKGPLTNITIALTKIFGIVKPFGFENLVKQEIARINTLRVNIQMDFVEKVNVIDYFGVLDLFSELGGLNASVNTMLASLLGFFLISFFYSFSSMVKRQFRHKRDHQLVKQNQVVINEILEELKEKEKNAGANEIPAISKEKEELESLLEEDYLKTYEDTEDRLHQIQEKVKKQRPAAVKDVFQYNAKQMKSKWEEIEHKENTEKRAIYLKKSNMSLSDIVTEIQQRMHFYSIYKLTDDITAHQIKLRKIKYHTRLQRDQIEELTNKIDQQQGPTDKSEKFKELAAMIKEQQKQIEAQRAQNDEQQEQINYQRAVIYDHEQRDKKFEERIKKLEQKVTIIKNIKKMELEQQIEMIERHANNIDDE